MSSRTHQTPSCLSPSPSTRPWSSWTSRPAAKLRTPSTARSVSTTQSLEAALTQTPGATSPSVEMLSLSCQNLSEDSLVPPPLLCCGASRDHLGAPPPSYLDQLSPSYSHCSPGIRVHHNRQCTHHSLIYIVTICSCIVCMQLHSMYAAACTPTHSFHIAIFQRKLRWQQLQNWMRWSWMSGDKIITCSHVKKNYATMQLFSDVKNHFASAPLFFLSRHKITSS